MNTYLLSPKLLCLSFLVLMLLIAGLWQASAADCPLPGGCFRPPVPPETQNQPACCNPPLIGVPSELEFFAVKGTTSVTKFNVTVCRDLENRNTGGYFLRTFYSDSADCSKRGNVGEGITPFKTSASDIGSDAMPLGTITITYTPTNDSDATFFVCLTVGAKDDSNCACEGCNQIKLIGHVLSATPSVTVSPTELNFFFDPDISRNPITITLTATGGDVQLNNLQFLDESGVDLLNNVPFEVLGLPPFTVLKKGVPFSFRIRVVPLPRGGIPNSFKGTVRITGEGVGLKNPISIELPTRINVASEVFGVPTLTQWGVMAMAFLIMTTGTIFILRKKKV